MKNEKQIEKEIYALDWIEKNDIPDNASAREKIECAVKIDALKWVLELEYEEEEPKAMKTEREIEEMIQNCSGFSYPINSNLDSEIARDHEVTRNALKWVLGLTKSVGVSEGVKERLSIRR